LVAQKQSKTSHIARWGNLGWLETLAKAVGIIAGMVAFLSASSIESVPLEGFTNTAAAILLGLITLGVFFSILIRIYQKEIISIIFAVASALGHAGMSYYLLRGVVDNGLPLVLGVTYIIGELIKQRFLTTTGYTELGANTSLMLLASRGLMLVYIIYTVLVLLA
jgi:hypothetical protein